MTPTADVIATAQAVLNERLGETPPQHAPANATMMHRREVQLMLWQLDQLTAMHRQAQRRLLYIEAQLETDLNRLHWFGADHVHPSDPRGAQLKDRLAQMEEKRQRLNMEFFDRQSRCLERLAVLVGRHELLQPPRPT